MIPLFFSGPTTVTKAMRYEGNPPTPNEYNRLRRDAGWPEMDPTVSADSLERSCSPSVSTTMTTWLGWGV